MREQWVGKNIDLALLSERIEGFLSNKAFKIRKEVSADGYAISTNPRVQENLGGVIVYIRGRSSDFVVEFATGKPGPSSAMLNFLMTMLGGGQLVLRNLKMQEAMEKLEREFWVYLEKTVDELTDSEAA